MHWMIYIGKPIYNTNNVEIEIKPLVQHKDVAAGNPFFFAIMGSDEYHHTTFSGKQDSDTHGVYWWFANMVPDCQFSQVLTMTMGQIPHDIPTHMTGKLLHKQWIDLMNNGVLLWTGEKLRKSYGMLSHSIFDLKERHAYMRRRGTHKENRCDGPLWYGYYHGCKWPSMATDLMQLGIIIPGKYLLLLWKYLNNDCVPQFWQKLPVNIGRDITLTKETSKGKAELGYIGSSSVRLLISTPQSINTW